MKLYIAVVCDRHSDEEVTAHLTRDAAIEYAKGAMFDTVAHKEYLIEEDDGERWRMTYEGEDDHAFVVEVEVPIYARPATRGRARPIKDDQT